MEPKLLTKTLKTDDFCPYYRESPETSDCCVNHDIRPKDWRMMCQRFPYCRATRQITIEYWEPYPKDYVSKMRVIRD